MRFVSDFTYGATWKGFVYAAFVLDALEQAAHDRCPVEGMGLVHHSDRGSRCLSIKYTERLAEAGIEPSVGRVGDSHDQAMLRHGFKDHGEGSGRAINGLFKAEVIHRRGPWRSFKAVEYATLEWPYGDAGTAFRLQGDWFNNHRLLEPI